MIKLVITYLVILIAIPTIAMSMEYGDVTENVIDSNAAPDTGKESVSLKLTINSFNLSTMKFDYNKDRYFNLASQSESNDDIYEVIGMFISKYDSKSRIKLKLKVNEKMEFNSAFITMKFTF